MIHSSSIIVASRQQVSSELAGETVVLQFERGEYYGLHAVGARVWQLVQTPQSFTALHNTILSEYDVPEDQCEHDLLALLNDMVDQQLVEVHDAGRS